ncbi:MAG: GntR family transcriptional regulator [Hyphomicrobiaceae bacterium]|nr:GntR family transcriptional regulator [Hyphomicrobiaceae bacterium]
MAKRGGRIFATAKSPAKRSLSDDVSRRIAEDYIATKKVAAGDLLPSEAELCTIYNVSRITVRAAIRSLWDHGLISVRNGVGAIVLPRANEVTHGLDRLASIDTFARQTGHKVETDHLTWEDIAADAEISQKLQIPVGALVLRVTRSKIVDNLTIAWIIDVLPHALIDKKSLQRKFKGSVLDVLLDDPRYRLDYADSEVKPCFADDKIRSVLTGNTDGLVLHLDTVTMTFDGLPILWGQIWLDPGHFRFSFHRRRFP